MEIPNSKFQTPSKFQSANSKLQTTAAGVDRAAGFDFWFSVLIRV
jgi:hypothetical protein